MIDGLRITEDGPDAFVGYGPEAPWGGLYGGLLVAHGLAAALQTVQREITPRSLRASFLRGAKPHEPLRYAVERTGESRSFTTRRVTVLQGDTRIGALDVSFVAADESPVHQLSTMPAVPPPEQLVDDAWSDVFERRAQPFVLGSGHSEMWLRWASDLGDDDRDHVVAMAFLSDDVPSEAIKAVVLETENGRIHFRKEWFAVSLDHAIWFHLPSRSDEWQLHVFDCHRFVAGRGLSVGTVFAADGTHVATIAQEMLFRRRH